MIRTTLGHYRITERIGAGGMGEVYRATDTRLGRDVALKVLPAELASDPERLERFQREARALAALDHPGIVSVYSVEESEGVHFLTMQLVEGQPLDSVISAGALPVERLLEIGSELADALAAAHAKGIIHRDLKPANVMVGESGHVKILDFGLAKIAEPEDVEDSDSQLATQARTSDGVVMGTVPYMSPEQLTGTAASTLSDIFSLGVILFEAATGRRPFEGRSSAELASAILRDTPPPVTDLRADLPGDVDRVLRGALAKKIPERTQTAQEVREALRALQRRLESAAGAPAASETASVPAPQAGPSLAVLPFENRSADPENEYFSDGLAEEILSVLAQIDGLRVAARTSSFFFKGKAVDIAEIGARLRVATVLEGSVRRSGNRVRVTVQLVDVSNGYQLWSERYDRQMEDIFDVQDEIARAIAQRLEVTLARGKSGPLVKAATRNIEAYDLYLKGRALLLKRGTAVAAGGECLQRAVALDSGMAGAWAGLADMYTIQGYWGMAPPTEAMPRALEAAQRAVDLDPTSGEAHCALANASLLGSWDYALAQREFLRGLELSPGYTQGRCWYALFYLLWISGRLDEGVAETRRALDADPLSAYAASLLALALCSADRGREGIEPASLAVERDPDAMLGHWILGHCYHAAGLFAEAVAALEKAASLSGRQHYTVATMSVVFADWGKRAEAVALRQEVEARSAREYVPRALLAITASATDDMDAAMALAREALDAREPPLLLFAQRYSTYERLRRDPRFQEILRAMKLPGMER